MAACAWNSAGYDGVHVELGGRATASAWARAGYDGVHVGTAGYDGVYVGTAGGNGVDAHGGTDLAGYFCGNVLIGGT